MKTKSALTNQYLLKILAKFSPNFCGLNNLNPSLFSKSTFAVLINDNNHFLVVYKKEQSCYYYDPVGLPPSNPKIISFLNNHLSEITINKKTHQDLRSNFCGFFVLFRILQLEYDFLSINFIPFHSQNLLLNDNICITNLSNLLKSISQIQKKICFTPQTTRKDNLINMLFTFVPNFLGHNPTTPPPTSNYACLFSYKKFFSALVVDNNQSYYYCPRGDVPPSNSNIITFLEKSGRSPLFNLTPDAKNSSTLTKHFCVQFILQSTYVFFKIIPFVPHSYNYNESITKQNIANFLDKLSRLKVFLKKTPTINKVPVFLL